MRWGKVGTAIILGLGAEAITTWLHFEHNTSFLIGLAVGCYIIIYQKKSLNHL